MSDHPTSAPALEIERATKSFVVSRHQFSTLKERALHPLKAREVQRRTVLRDISVNVARGEFFGIVGRNGSGKSTLLKCIAGIYQLDSGRIRVYGRLAPFIELGVGFNYELTARDNILTNAVMLGLSRREARRRFDAIIDFAELHDFVDMKLKNYSSGMAVRLAFSVAIQVDADILLVDEVLAVGDAAFQQKCFAEFRRMRRENRTVLFVTHDMASLTRFCERAMLIEGGRCIELGPAEDVARRYNEVNFGRLEGAEIGPPGRHLRAVWFENGNGRRTTHADQGGQVALCCEIDPPAVEPESGTLALKATLRNDVRHTIVVLDTRAPHCSGAERLGALAEAGEPFVAKLSFPCQLAPSAYSATVELVRGDQLVDRLEDAAALTVHSRFFSGGVWDAPFALQVAGARVPAGGAASR